MWVEDEAKASQGRAKVLEEAGRRWKWNHQFLNHLHNVHKRESLLGDCVVTCIENLKITKSIYFGPLVYLRKDM